MSKGNFENVQTIKQAIANHLANRTTLATFRFVAKCWATDIELGDDAQSIVEGLDKLESKMLAEHGWSRKDKSFMQSLCSVEISG